MTFFDDGVTVKTGNNDFMINFFNQIERNSHREALANTQEIIPRQWWPDQEVPQWFTVVLVNNLPPPQIRKHCLTEMLETKLGCQIPYPDKKGLA